MKLGDMTFSKMLEVCDSHICVGCPLYRRYAIFYNKATNEYEHCLIKSIFDKSVAYVVQNETVEIEGGR